MKGSESSYEDSKLYYFSNQEKRQPFSKNRSRKGRGVCKPSWGNIPAQQLGVRLGSGDKT